MSQKGRCGTHTPPTHTQWNITQQLKKKETNLVIVDNMDGPRGCYAK